jgi:hypothetical protein
MTQLKELGGTMQHTTYLPSQGTAGTDDHWQVWNPQFNATVTGVKFVPNAAITHDATNFSTYTLTNKGTGAGTTSMATRAWSATDSVADTPESMTLSGTAANLLVTSGDAVSMVKTHGGTGLVIPAGVLVIQYTLR